MICQQVTWSGYAELPKVADAVIEAHGHIFHMRSLREEPNGSTTCNDADPCPTLRTRVHRLSLTASLDAQTGTQVHTGLSSRLSPHLMAPVYGHAMAVLACPDRCAGPTGHSPHDGLQ